MNQLFTVAAEEFCKYLEHEIKYRAQADEQILVPVRRSEVAAYRVLLNEYLVQSNVSARLERELKIAEEKLDGQMHGTERQGKQLPEMATTIWLGRERCESKVGNFKAWSNPQEQGGR